MKAIVCDVSVSNEDTGEKFRPFLPARVAREVETTEIRAVCDIVRDVFDQMQTNFDPPINAKLMWETSTAKHYRATIEELGYLYTYSVVVR